MGQVEVGGLDELALGANALEEHDQLQLEEDHRIDARSATRGIERSCPFADEAQIEFRFEMAGEVVSGNERFQRDPDRFVEAAGFGRAEHRGLLGRGWPFPYDESAGATGGSLRE